MSIGNIAIDVRDLARSEAFYTEALGLQVVARIGTPDVEEVIVGTPGEGSQLMLARRSAVEVPAPAGIWKIYVSTDDAEALYERAVAWGATPVEPPRHLERFRVTIAFVSDPDGYLVELGQRHEAAA